MAGMAGMNIGSSVVGSALNGLMNMGFQEFAANRQHERDLESMDHQADLNRAQYDYERMMESPTRIAQQYEQAGLNPALAMSSGATSPGMTASVSPSSAVSNPASSPFKGSSISLPSIAELQRVEHQNALDDARAARELAETEWRNHQNALAPLIEEFQQSKNYSQKLENDMKEINNLYQPLLFDSSLRKDLAYVSNLFSKTYALGKEADLSEAQRSYYNNLAGKVFSETLMQDMFNFDYYERGSYGNRGLFETIVGYATRVGPKIDGSVSDFVDSLSDIPDLSKPALKLLLESAKSSGHASKEAANKFIKSFRESARNARPHSRPLPRTLITPR